MPEAEDVILEAAEHATAAARALWKRARVPERGVALDDVARPLGLLLTACLGGPWPVRPSDPPPPAGWLARRLGKPPPWAIAPLAQGFTDGTHIFLPRRLELEGVQIAARRLLSLVPLSP